ncbi:MAG TPA: AbrB/MazE/SpoVT family DNA-binding domain-containing protein [Dehalococcoidia bacterium]|nr:AbrB/MazE/SpoVT family DNA-binding domain-containing protein [Dehalococcoidia bacterium]
MHSVRVDAKGRLSIPKAARDKLAVRPGDVFYMEIEGSVLRFSRAQNPFDALAEGTAAEYRAGRTRKVHEIAGERDGGLDAGYDSEAARAAIVKFSGSWSDLDPDKIIAEIYRRRQVGSRPAGRP